VGPKEAGAPAGLAGEADGDRSWSAGSADVLAGRADGPGLSAGRSAPPQFGMRPIMIAGGPVVLAGSAGGSAGRVGGPD